jgi:hypothetical protein
MIDYTRYDCDKNCPHLNVTGPEEAECSFYNCELDYDCGGYFWMCGDCEEATYD